MKYATLALLASLVSFNAFAAKSELVAVCQSEQTKLTVRKVGVNDFKATVETEVAGGGRAKFTFKNIQKNLPKNGPVGSPYFYTSSEVSIAIQGTVRKPFADLSVPSLGINGERLSDCEF